ncbi:MAG: D-alanyl-D-alanine carboxypeptidase/D-alanyl-D-alanine-endopeptidase [Planctomycetes bacterium]|nr:D-alanyl-D-alanine carboxypeptidase/D-alanyl-D-alanine-endopeptidase [Planctomycetota bacterium]
MSRRCGPALGAAALAFLAAGCAATGSDAAIAAALARFVAAAEGAGGRVGVVVVDADSGRTLAAHAERQGFVPASNAKLVTAVVALHTLGPWATLRTELLVAGEVHDGELRGDLVLRGFGDPTLGLPWGRDPRLQQLVAAVVAAGVRRVAGSVRGDGGWLGGERHGQGWPWHDLDEDYAPPFGGLCCGGNVERVERDGGPSGRRPVADPAAFAARTLQAQLAAAGIGVADGEGMAGGPERLLAVVHSPPLAELLRPLLADSDNLVAEQLWRVAARAADGVGTAAAAAHTRTVLAALGIDAAGLVQVDGSGLSRLDLVQPAQVAALLAAARRQPWGEAFAAALPLAGVSGTLAGRLAAGPAHRRVRAKTGTLQRVTALSGWLERADGGALLFSILWNDFLVDAAAARATVDAFVQDLAAVGG